MANPWTLHLTLEFQSMNQPLKIEKNREKNLSQLELFVFSKAYATVLFDFCFVIFSLDIEVSSVLSNYCC